LRQIDWPHFLAFITAASLVVGIALWSLFRFFQELFAGMRETEMSYRAKENRCLSCGYRLAGNVSGTCPECGAAVTQAATKGPT
jgi:hypothetical protein